MKVSIFVLAVMLACSYQLINKDLTMIRDTVLEKKLHYDLKKLAMMTEKNTSDENLKKFLSNIENFYAPYPRVSCIILLLYKEVGQIEKASLYMKKIENFKERFNKEEMFFFENLNLLKVTD